MLDEYSEGYSDGYDDARIDAPSTYRVQIATPEDIGTGRWTATADVQVGEPYQYISGGTAVLVTFSPARRAGLYDA